DPTGHSPDPSSFAAHEQALLQHYRAHDLNQPSAALDAQILAAAATNLQRAPQRGAMTRLHDWLFAGSQRLRWSVAFASLATLGLGLGLTLRTFERSPEHYDVAPVPMLAPAPAMQSAQSYGQPAEKKRSAQLPMSEAPPAPAAPMAEAQKPMAEARISAKAAPSPTGSLADSAAKAEAPMAELAADQPAQELSEELQSALRRIIQLRGSGQETLASEQLAALQRRYPGLDLSAELNRLQAAEAKGPGDLR
ncbi:MAG: hypothetical protein ACRERX_00305, partial [Pseudomonas sp.]